jgi:hypothetical protein
MRNVEAISGRMRSRCLICLALLMLPIPLAQAASPWEQPAAQLAAHVAEILGSGQAQLVVNNRSTIAAAEITPIRHLLEQDLRTHGVIVSGAESANMIRVTLSENARERLWIAEVVEGNQTQVAMVHLDRESLPASPPETGIVLEKKRIWSTTDRIDSTAATPDSPVLAALEMHDALVVLEQEQILILTKTPAGWHEDKRWSLDQSQSRSRDPRGLLQAAANGFTAVMPGRQCEGSFVPSQDANASRGDWTVHCHESDDPWPVEATPSELHAFYNAARNYFTGVITPNQGADPSPFYNIAALPRPVSLHPALLINGIDGKLQLLEGNSLKPVTGARDWGSDFAAIHTSCGAGTQVLASASGEAENDSLRAYELPSQEAIAISSPLEMGGPVTALWTSPDGASAWAIVRKNAKEYEVDRVTALCP